jgi:hypothetical protein
MSAHVWPAPIYAHQFSVIRLGYYLTHRILEGDLGVLLTAPFDIRLPGRLADPWSRTSSFSGKAMSRTRTTRTSTGVPDLVIEVLSPGTRKVDERIKMSIYREAGIPEYWLVNPKTRTVLIHRLSEDGERYIEWARGEEGDVVGSTVLPGLRLAVGDILPR